MFGIRGTEWIIILVVALLVLGPSKLPSLARSVGRALTEFKTGLKEVEDDIKSSIAEPKPRPAPPPPPPEKHGAVIELMEPEKTEPGTEAVDEKK